MALKALTIESMKKYELNVIFAPTLSESDFQHGADEVRALLKENTKGVFFEDMWGMRNFAYRIKKYDQGYYAVFYFEAEPEQIAEVRANIKLNTSILRHLLIILPDKFEAKRAEDYALAELTSIQEEPKKRSRRFVKKKTEAVGKPDVVKQEAQPVEALASAGGSAEPMLKGETEEERLQEVEKTLESILENPDIKLK